MLELKLDLNAMGITKLSKLDLENLLEVDISVERKLRQATNSRLKITFKDGIIREGILDSPEKLMKEAFQGGMYWFKAECGIGEKLFWSSMVKSVEIL
jgi:hypothetical protein